jgi:glycosyltransferase involved in cell wall biosynthesis
MKLCIEGWRGINHSYALVNQWQLLELAKLPILIHHKDVRYYNLRWNNARNSNGFSAEQNKIINSIPAYDSSENYDSCYRISYPIDIGFSKAERLFVFGTAELQSTEGHFINGGAKEREDDDKLSIITPSHWSKAGFLRAGFKPDRIIVVPHGIDPNTFFPLTRDEKREHRRLLNVDRDARIVLSVGAMTGNKGIPLLLLAFAHLRKRYRKLRLILKDQSNLYGVYPQTYLQQLVVSPNRSLFTDDVIQSIAFVSQNLDFRQLRLLYGIADIYVSPYQAEGFNIPPLEAAACGTPIVVTKGGSTDDYFDPALGAQIQSTLQSNGAQSVLVPDLESLIFEMTQVLERKKEVGGRKGANYVHANFSWARICKNLESILTKDKT